MTNIKLNHIRAIACLMVVLLHTTGSSANVYNGFFKWEWALLIDSLTRSSVPLFVMLSGALLGRNKDSITLFYQKRLKRIIIPFFIWTVLFFLFRHLYLQKYSSASGIITEIISGPVYFHFWYLYMIIGLYLFIPFILPWLRNSSQKEQLIFVCITFLFSGVYKLYEYKFSLEPGVDLIQFGGFIGYFVLGFYLSNHYQKISKWIYLILFLLGSSVTFMVNFKLSNKTPVLLLHDYKSITTYVSAFGLFGFFLCIELNKIVSKLFNFIAEYSFGIYFLHVIPLKILFDYNFLNLNKSGIEGILLYWILVISITTPIIYLVSKIPFIGKYLK